MGTHDTTEMSLNSFQNAGVLRRTGFDFATPSLIYDQPGLTLERSLPELNLWTMFE